MADFSLNLDLATLAVREDSSKGAFSPSRRKKLKSPKVAKSSHTPGNEFRQFERKSMKDKLGLLANEAVRSTLAKQQDSSSKSGKSESSSKSSSRSRKTASRRGDKGPVRLFQEVSDTDEESSEDDSFDYGTGDESLVQRYVRNGSRNKKTSMQTRAITGNVDATQLSIAGMLDDRDLAKLAKRDNYGIVIQPIGFWNVGKKNRKAKHRGGLMNITVTKFDFTPKRDEEEDANSGHSRKQASAIIYAQGSARRKQENDKNLWPPKRIGDTPDPPPEKPPRASGSSRLNFIRRASLQGSQLPGSFSPRSNDKWRGYANESSHTPPQLQGSSSKAAASGILKKLTSFRGPPSSHPSSPTLPPKSVTTVLRKDRFLVSKKVPWVIPPPPKPQKPPKDGSKEHEIKKNLELLMMFCEDLASTQWKIELTKKHRTVKIARLQNSIQKLDDEIASLVNPKKSHVGKNVDMVTSQVKSVTTGNVFRVEKYGSASQS
mmetsp:Transcript_148/g.201  ORF Transcript_148/g.201 Transcript_148/m.201 type:complete len:489 (-) Transcript_148:268-1734(-)